MSDNIRVYHRTAQQHRYVIVDATRRDELPKHWAQHVVAPAFLGDDTDRCPALLDLQALDSTECAEFCAILDQQVQARDECLASLMLAAPVDAPVLAGYLRQRIAIKLSPKDRDFKQFRFFDPGTFLQLPTLLGDDGMVWLMGLVTSVLVPWAGQWTTYERPVSHDAFTLDAEHVQAIKRLGIINRVAAQDERPCPDAATWIRQCQSIDAHVLRAMSQYGLAERGDLVAFARHALTHHSRFDAHPRMQALLHALRKARPEDELDYRELSGRLQAEDWAEMAHELKQQKTQEARTS